MAFAIGVILVVVLSLLPPRSLPSFGVSDKIEHFIAYAILGLIAGFAFATQRAAVWLMAFLSALGITLELCQWFVPGRSPETLDAIASVLGTCVVLCTHVLLRPGSAEKIRIQNINSAAARSTNNAHTPRQPHS
ncbi:MAG: VanZ family protein [Aestuariivirga sp.]